jgi:hypothetical protein
LLKRSSVVVSCDASINQIRYTVLVDDDDDDRDDDDDDDDDEDDDEDDNEDDDDVDSVMTTDGMSSLWRLNLTRFKMDCFGLVVFVGNTVSCTLRSSV